MASPAPSANSSFSPALPGLQLAVYSTSLGEFKVCPRKYQLAIVEGWEPKGPRVDLEFGLLYHGALERYDHRRSEGLGHEEALQSCLGWLLRSTWNKALGRPWLSGDANKNRLTLVCTVVDYLDRFGLSDSLQTVILAGGKPAVELNFRFWSGLNTQTTAEPISFCGYLDRLVSLEGQYYVVDRKTTRKTLGPSYWSQFSPHNQFSLYILAAQVTFQLPAKSLIVDAAQIAVNFTRFERGIVQRDDSQLAEWHKDAGWQIRHMEQCAREEYWPQNDQSCDRYGGGPFRGVCAKSVASRELWLSEGFKKRVWDPLQKRGDV